MQHAPIRTIPLLEEYVPGSVIGEKYRLEAVIGRGGMGSVWRAHNLFLEMPVAIKLIRPGVRGAETTALLLNEARLAAKLEHPSVVRLFDFGVAETGDAYIVMELLNGSSLADLLERHGKLSAIAAVQLLLPIVHGLAAAHHRGIVHLDLKPENIALCDVGVRWQPKLLDFGIAEQTGRRNTKATDSTLVGSPAYMSPEQARGRSDIDARADVWGVCIVLYELVAGRVPFAAATPFETLRAVVETEPAPFDADDVGTRSLWSIVRKGLAKDRQRRFASAHELGDALAQWLIDRDEHEDVCGELLVSNWGSSARARVRSPSIRLHSEPEERARNDSAVVRSTPTPAVNRTSLVWIGAAAALTLAIAAAAVLVRVDSSAHERVYTGIALGARTAPPEEVRVAAQPPNPGEGSTVAHAALSGHASGEALTSKRPSVASLPKPASPAPEPRAAGRVTKLSSKTVQRARSREAELGLKDPFE